MFSVVLLMAAHQDVAPVHPDHLPRPRSRGKAAQHPRAAADVEHHLRRHRGRESASGNTITEIGLADGGSSVRVDAPCGGRGVAGRSFAEVG